MGSSLAVAGDFKCTLAPADVQPVAGMRPDQTSRTVGAAELLQVTEGEGLVDARHSQHPHTQ
jgi:hypothetical protein